jgi:hypothetical protein
MLIDVSFKNFISFSDECFFDMTANSDKSHRDNLIENKYSKIKIIYGSNASGKTSFIKAIDFIRAFVFNSNNMIESSPIQVNPFKFRSNPADEPSSFAITFIKNDKKYHYEFSCTKERVVDEKLDIYNSSKPTNIFERVNTDEYIFKHDVKKLRDISKKNTRNKLFLVTSATWNYEETKPVVDFIMKDLMVSYGFEGSWKVFLDKIIADKEYEAYKAFCLKFLNNADISIGNFEIKEKKYKDVARDPVADAILSALTKNNPDSIEKIANSSVYNINVMHKVQDECGVSEYFLDLHEESLGTIQMFELAPILYYVFKNGVTLFVDEIDRSLHPLLVKYLIKLFLNDDVNKNSAQLIANTHDTNLLDLEIFRRDEIWFTERDYNKGSTTLFPLSDFSPRKDENIEKAYLLGRFGAIPFIKGE